LIAKAPVVWFNEEYRALQKSSTVSSLALSSGSSAATRRKNSFSSHVLRPAAFIYNWVNLDKRTAGLIKRAAHGSTALGCSR